jgi:hypothetical protein
MQARFVPLGAVVSVLSPKSPKSPKSNHASDAYDGSDGSDGSGRNSWKGTDKGTADGSGRNDGPNNAYDAYDAYDGSDGSYGSGRHVTCITIIDTIILTNNTNDAYTYDTGLMGLGGTDCLSWRASLA